jgi:antitoxin component of RelBE/YafQ-DinJ toxin-antitoxin module
MRAAIGEPMKTISARLPEEDVELFQLICDEYNLSQSEAIRFLVQACINQTFESDKENHAFKTLATVRDFEAYQRKKEYEKFYESFKQLNRTSEREKELHLNSV